jgi:hypothetical protein
MVLINDVLRRYTLLQRLDRDRHSVFVGTANEYHIFTGHPQEPDVNICGDIDPGQVPDVDGAIGVRKRRGDGISFNLVVCSHGGTILTMRCKDIEKVARKTSPFKARRVT